MMMDEAEGARDAETAADGSPWEVFRVFLILGLTSFGGPVAHLGYFRDAFVTRRQWIGDRDYADLVALCQFLPGPSSSQVGMAIGLRRAGYGGMAAAWTGFTLPSALLLVAFAYGQTAMGLAAGGGWIQGLKAAAVAVVAQAVLGMARTLAIGPERATIAVAGMVIVTLFPTAWSQIAAIALGAAAGLSWLRDTPPPPEAGSSRLSVQVGAAASTAALIVFAGLLIVLPLMASLNPEPLVKLVDGFYRAGALVFGGGHVVLPLLQAATVETGLVGREAFLAGYGATQAMPGPLFTFAAYLGAIADGPFGAVAGLLAIFVPSALLLIGALPYWERLRSVPTAIRALAGVNATVVGILAAALYDPVFTEGVTSRGTLAVAAVAFVLLVAWRAPAWLVVVLAGLTGGLML